jgi:hypothetical protein
MVKAPGYEPEGADSRSGEVKFQIYLILQTAVSHGFTQPVTEISTRNIKKKEVMFLGSKVRLVWCADKFTAIYELIGSVCYP